MISGRWNTSDLVKIMYFLPFLSVLILIVTGDGDDFTCYNHYPRLTTAGETDAYIGGFTSGEDTDATVTFARAFDTYTGTGLPSGSYQEGNLLKMPSGGIERIGVFSCIFQKGGTTYTIPMMNQHKDANVLPTRFSITANKGDTVDIVMQSTLSLYWRIDGGGVRHGWDDKTTVTLPNVENNNAGVYESHKSDAGRSDGLQAFTQLIVRGCSANKWGPSCQNDCPLCYNGGVCHDQSGVCVCAPGFSGTYCENVHGRNRFGQDGQISCTDTDPNGCKGRFFCLPDPYGCSCGAGYQGLDCNSECSNGKFGADCTQDCHCKLGNSDCQTDTGECLNGGCDTGWKGVNCQDFSISSINITSSSSSSLDVSWIGDADSYQIDYQLIQKDQCGESGHRTTFGSTSDNFIEITSLFSYSTYDVFVKPVSNVPTCLISEKTKTAATQEMVPAVAPGNIHVSAETTTSLTFTWDEIPCGSRGGDISYRYTIDTSTHTTTSTSITVNNLTPCSTYQFTVLASNAAGDGASGSSEGSTENEVPGAVTSLTVLPDSSQPDSLIASWDAPYPPCAERYRVEYQLMNLDQCNEADSNREFYGTIASRSATIPELQPYSTYTIYVTAENDIGSGEETNQTERTAITAPNGPPSDVQNTSRTNTSLTFEWLEVACGYRGGPNKYMYELNDNSGKQISSGTTANLELTISGLIPCTTYNFKVKASNGEGDGVFSELINCATDIAEIGPVRLLITDEISSDEWTLSWNPQDANPCPTNEYFVEYALLEHDNCSKIEYPEIIEYGSVTITSATIAGLQPYSMYEMYVYASNDIGRGERMSTIDYTKESVPSGPPTTMQAFPDKHSIILSWEEPSCGNRSGTIQHYSYNLMPGGQESTTEFKNVTFDELNPCSKYRFAISAATSVGEGPQDLITTTTEKEVPLQPSNLRLADKGVRELSVEWDDPDQIFCPIESYFISIRTVYKPYDVDFTPNPEPDKELQTDSMYHKFTDLAPSTEYEFKAYANGEAGRGDFTARIFSTHPAEEQELGEPLQKPTIVQSNATTLTVEIPQLTGTESEFLTDFKIYVERPNVYVLAQSPDPKTSYEVGNVQKTEVEDEPKEFVVGSGQTEQNPPLEIGQKYKIYIGSCSVIKTDQSCVWSPPVSHGFSGEETNDDIVWIVVVTLLSAIIVGVVGVTFIGLLIYKQRQRHAIRTLDQRDGQQLEMDPYTNLGLVDEPAPYEDMHIQGTNTNWTISWTDLELSDNILGKGSFGEVREGVCKRGRQYLPVAVKTLKSKATSKDKSDFYSEFETMKKIGHHRNIVSLIGACEYEGTLYVALEYVACGDLRTYLRITRRRNQKGASHQVPPKKLLQFAFDVAKGMEHLSSIGIIHRDLAARNILLSDDLVAKVSDFGMSRGEDVYVKTSKQRVPTRWLAIESLCYSTYTTRSDVWSFAVLLWEIATFGATPYSDIATRDLAGLFSEGYRLPKPASLDSAVYDMMTQCWSIDPEERPSFTQIAATLDDMQTQKQRTYVDTRAYENFQFPAISPERDDN